MMPQTILEYVLLLIPQFCFGYPFVMAWYWMAGGLIYYAFYERSLPPPDQPPSIANWPPISILVPCYNEGDNAEETLRGAASVDYPDFEVIAINDGSRDNTAEVLDRLASEIPRLRVVHLAKNSGKATALNTGAALARHELLVCIDGDAMLDPHALRWIARTFLVSGVGAIAGNPRIRNRTSLLGRLQVGEFSSIIGLIRRAQTAYGRMFTVCGVICAFRKHALHDAGWWSPLTLTEDIDVTWRVQLAGWRVTYQPNAVVWILMPETLRGLWKQRLRWAEGGVEMMFDFFRPMVSARAPSMWPTYLNVVASLLWSYCMVFALVVGILWSAGVHLPAVLPGFQLVPEWWGLTLAITYLAQALVSHLLERRYERGMLRGLFWIIWYPLAFWLINVFTSVAALPRVLLRPRRATWESPDRGLR